MKTFGNVIGAGVAKFVIPGACTVMSKVCWSSPGGSISFTSSGATTLMPTCALLTGCPLLSRLLGITSTVRYCCCAGGRFSAASGFSVTIVVWLAVTGVRIVLATRGRYIALTGIGTPFASRITFPLASLTVITGLFTPAENIVSITISGK